MLSSTATLVQKIIKTQETKSLITFTKSLGGNMRNPKDFKTYDEYVDYLGSIIGCDDATVKGVLDGWIRAQEKVKLFKKFMNEEKTIGGNHADQ